MAKERSAIERISAMGYQIDDEPFARETLKKELYYFYVAVNTGDVPMARDKICLFIDPMELNEFIQSKLFPVGC